ncbi:MAG: alpha/beta hydrolase, partial [Ilumatobacteraceae bacterium]|nr:alpha/beta hydrolase [Ilumatobacteraceae bacterium]
MPLHPQAESLLALMASLDEPLLETCTPAQAREVRARRLRPSTEPIHHTRDVDAGGVPARFYRPNDREDLGLLVFFHGGGWVLGNLESHDNLCRILANSSGHCVLSVDYRLAPEHPFPAALDDALAATRWAYANAGQLACSPDRLAVGGDSAGGNLAIVVGQLAPVPLRYQLLIYPATDLTTSFPSFVENAAGPQLTAAGMGWFISHYLGESSTSRTDPRVSPHFAADDVVAASPPTMLITAQYDPLRDEGDAYAARLASLGVPTSHVRFSGMYHGFFSLADFYDDAIAANHMAGAALGRVLS